jgi:hypothetical protein
MQHAMTSVGSGVTQWDSRLSESEQILDELQLNYYFAGPDFLESIMFPIAPEYTLRCRSLCLVIYTSDSVHLSPSPGSGPL